MLKIMAHIPAREGSKRLASKNLLNLAGHPLLSYAVRTALASKHIDEVYINTESQRIAAVGEQYGARTYLRDIALAQDEVTQDTFNYDFIKNKSPDILVLLNPVCPLITHVEIDAALELFLQDPTNDCLITVTTYHAHALMNEAPINFSTQEILPRTQDIPPVKIINWAFGIWNAHTFRKNFEAHGHACIFGKTLWFEIPKSKAIKINDQDDFDMAEAIIRSGQKSF